MSIGDGAFYLPSYSPYQLHYNDCKSTQQAISQPYDDGISVESSGGSVNSGRQPSDGPSHKHPPRNGPIFQPVVKQIVASDAMRKASNDRARREQKYLCPIDECGVRLTTKAGLTSSLFFHSPADLRC